MNDYEPFKRFPHFSSIPHYSIAGGDRNAPLTISHATRADLRGCPVTPRSRSTSGRDLEAEPGGGQPRRRIAVACARCRKRKIRCSGDPGNGSGCQNCRTAGADISQCQFHRVGSGDPFSIINNMAGPTGGHMSSPVHGPNANQNSMIPIYSASSPIYQRTFPNNQFPTISTKSIYPQTWTSVPYTDDSPVESYGLQSTACVSSQDSIGSIYGVQDSLRWGGFSQKAIANGNGLFLDQDTAASYTGSGIYLNTPIIRTAVTTESFSPLSMTSLHSTLPVAPNDRQLPIPQSTRSQSTTIAVDQLHMRSLPSSQSTNVNSINSNGTYTKAAMAWNTEGSVTKGRQSSVTSPSSGEIAASTPPKSYSSTTTAPEGVLGYIPVTTSSPEQSPTSTAHSLMYNTTSESMPAPIISNGYSNFRHHGPPHVSPSERRLSRDGSSSNLYSFSADNLSKRNSLGEISSSEGTLVSGRRYTPLCQPQPQQATGIDALRRDSFDQRPIPTHCSSTSSLNHNF